MKYEMEVNSFMSEFDVLKLFLAGTKILLFMLRLTHD